MLNINEVCGIEKEGLFINIIESEFFLNGKIFYFVSDNEIIMLIVSVWDVINEKFIGKKYILWVEFI